MPRKKRDPREEWELRADEKVLDSQAPSVPLPKRQPRQKAATVNTADDAIPTVEPQRILPRELEVQHKLQEFEEFSSGLMCEVNSGAAGLSSSRCEGYTEGLGKFCAGEIGEERSRSDVASEAFGHDSVREAYQELGPAGFYELKGASYVNPHENVLSEAIQLALDDWHRSQVLPFPRRSLDLACGSGEATVALEAWLHKFSNDVVVEASDPYTFEAFERRLGRGCHRWSFENIAEGALEQEPIYDLVLCSFALHLLDRSWITCTLSSLARRAQFLMVATPHKRPVIEKRFGILFALDARSF